MAAIAKPPAGMAMMFKALGVDMSVISQVAGAVKTIADKLEAIEKNQQKILAQLGAPESSNGNGRTDL
ncbi:MAG TPA: hypothetical protein VN785_12265 [Candidatus Angelobacter sp.]|nr:hypothetical protein [Candidatus Angelobacter sp.]